MSIWKREMTDKPILKAIIPAAGLGTRFLPATISTPKEMLIILDKPVIQYVVEDAVRAKIKDILIVTRSQKRAIEDHFDPPYELKDILAKRGKTEELEEVLKVTFLANIHFIRQKELNGLGDAIYQGKSFIGEEPFAVLAGDTVIDSSGTKSNLENMVKLFHETGKSVVLVENLADKKDVLRFGIVKPSGIIKKSQSGVPYYDAADLVEKPSVKEAPSKLAIATQYIFTPEIFSLIEKTKAGKGGEIQITDSMRMLAKEGKLLAYPIEGKRFDIGNKSDFLFSNLHFALKDKVLKKEILNYIKDERT